MWNPWHYKFSSFQPFQLDALGLVTLLGAEEVNAALGRLVSSRYVEYFPFLGAFVVAGNRFTDKRSSFGLYNFTDGIYTTDLACWLSRWLLAQKLEENRSIVCLKVEKKPKQRILMDRLVAGSLSFVFTGLLLVMTILSGDWYGLANVLAMIGMITVRTYVLEANRSAIDRTVLKEKKKCDDAAEAYKNGQGDLSQRKDAEKLEKYCKCLVILSDAKAVTVLVPSYLVPLTIKNPIPKHERVYTFVRMIGWLTFGVHVLSIGNSFLPNQIYAVGLIVIPTMLMNWKLGCDDSKWTEKTKELLKRSPVSSAQDEEMKIAPSTAGSEAFYTCFIGTQMSASVYHWPDDYMFVEEPSEKEADGKKYRLVQSVKEKPHRNRRQDLYAWLNLTKEEELSMGKWDLLPHERNDDETWWRDYAMKRDLIKKVQRDWLKFIWTNKQLAPDPDNTTVLSDCKCRCCTEQLVCTGVEPATDDVSSSASTSAKVEAQVHQAVVDGRVSQDSTRLIVQSPVRASAEFAHPFGPIKRTGTDTMLTQDGRVVPITARRSSTSDRKKQKDNKNV